MVKSNSGRRHTKLWVVLWLLSLVAVLVWATRGKASPDTVFFGDSITEGWSLPSVNFGIFGNTTTQMLARFNEVTDGHFARVVMMGGTNDVLQGFDPEVTIANLHQMIARARAKRLTVIVGQIPPIYKDNGVLLPKVDALNERIAAEVKSWQSSGEPVYLVNYNSAVKGHLDGYASDGIHLRHRNYARMEWQLLKVANVFRHGN